MQAHSMDEAAKQRWENLCVLIDVAPFGALFRVDEVVWTAGLGVAYAARTNRNDHPGCSIRRSGATLGPIPMLHGTSRRSYSHESSRESIAVEDVYGKPHTTYFGGLDPVPVDQEHWARKNVKPAPKPSLTLVERANMKALCDRKGW